MSDPLDVADIVSKYPSVTELQDFYGHVEKVLDKQPSKLETSEDIYHFDRENSFDHEPLFSMVDPFRFTKQVDRYEWGDLESTHRKVLEWVEGKPFVKSAFDFRRNNTKPSNKELGEKSQWFIFLCEYIRLLSLYLRELKSPHEIKFADKAYYSRFRDSALAFKKELDQLRKHVWLYPYEELGVPFIGPSSVSHYLDVMMEELELIKSVELSLCGTQVSKHVARNRLISRLYSSVYKKMDEDAFLEYSTQLIKSVMDIEDYGEYSHAEVRKEIKDRLRNIGSVYAHRERQRELRIASKSLGEIKESNQGN